MLGLGLGLGLPHHLHWFLEIFAYSEFDVNVSNMLGRGNNI